MLWNNEAIVGGGMRDGAALLGGSSSASGCLAALPHVYCVMNQVVSIFDLSSVPRGRASVSLLALITFLSPQPGLPAAEAALIFVSFLFSLRCPSDIYPVF